MIYDLFSLLVLFGSFCQNLAFINLFTKEPNPRKDGEGCEASILRDFHVLNGTGTEVSRAIEKYKV